MTLSTSDCKRRPVFFIKRLPRKWMECGSVILATKYTVKVLWYRETLRLNPMMIMLRLSMSPVVDFAFSPIGSPRSPIQGRTFLSPPSETTTTRFHRPCCGSLERASRRHRFHPAPIRGSLKKFQLSCAPLPSILNV